ncbi:3-methyl-2-oxobutanoate dehydrogenase [lipoamide] kinase, mitochondrial [Exaiptasia diaphana]|uniref:Protein-serine/threonine kinase n=1 Tax=Exaiptasia diaphana TaxID=2652724 RepID=A0A913Y5H6_EXADI|nr:3-methyl-2-oxobutanoate dehydrogenase [lipoamide] kinase, mitochondrial [Exaiptasia diaphana]KXJ29018.1 [3-methyl-2-oxobutanoate dehydrogenase [lipoamide]] kinase, mitochondrial [Exaiptasia diaphana]
MRFILQSKELSRLAVAKSKLPKQQCGLSSMSMYGSQTQPWSYVRQQTLDEYASKSSIRLTPYQMLYAGKFKDGSHLIKSAQYLQKEMPIRIARRVVDLQQLPYIVLSNPVMHDVYELYLRAFSMLTKFPKVESLEDEGRYSHLITGLLDDHQHVVTNLAEGFQECKNHISYDAMGNFLDKTLTSRLAMRMLAEHHIGLRNEKPNYIGIICTHLNLKQVIERSCDFARQICEHLYGVAPGVIINGHTKAIIPFIPAPLEYILQELIKNAMRASVEYHYDQPLEIPNLVITICTNDTDFYVRISDRGGGIPEKKLNSIFKYSFTTMKDRSEIKPSDNQGIFGAICEGHPNNSPSGGPIAGWGFGLPTSRAYANYLGGSLAVQTMEGLGTDVYLRLGHITGSKESFRI